MYANQNQGKSGIAYGFAKRADGSIRQMIKQDQKGNVLDRGYCPPGTTKDEAVTKRCFHWADAFTDAELAQHYGMTSGEIESTRAEAVVANKQCRFVDLNRSKQP